MKEGQNSSTRGTYRKRGADTIESLNLIISPTLCVIATEKERSRSRKKRDDELRESVCTYDVYVLV